MKFPHMLFGAAFLITACSSPKYVYHFDHYDYASGKKDNKNVSQTIEEHPLELKEQILTASADDKVVVADRAERTLSPSGVNALAEKYKAMSKDDRREFRKELKKEVKNYVKKDVLKKDSGDTVDAIKEFDTTVSLAILFGAAGIVFILLAGVSNAFWVLGAISIVIGAVFFVRWVANGNG